MSKGLKIAILGYGKMGHLIASIAEQRGHDVFLRIDENNRQTVSDEELRKADVVIEFSTPESAVANYKWCFDNGVSVVSGTTGWLAEWDNVCNYCKDKNSAFLYSSNFSIGVNIFFALNTYLAKLMDKFHDYSVFVEETHHIHKLDAPSGTAISLAKGIIDNHSAYDSWKLNDGTQIPTSVLPVTAKRIGEVPGYHAVTYKSDVDEIEIHHNAYSREGFAKGAVMAAEFLAGKKGVYNMNDMLKIG